jgi:arylsulfatase A-like enzyme
MWAKNTNFDKSLHVPLMMKIPWLQPAGPAYINGFFEHLDLYRTTAGLFGLSSFVAADVEGFDHSANIKAALTAARSPLAPTLPWSRDASYAQVVRCAFADRCQNLVSSVTVQGFTIRTAKWRYSIFVNSTGITPMFGRLLAEELYDHSADTSTALQDEAVNLAAQQPQVCSSLRALLQQRFGGSSLPV